MINKLIQQKCVSCEVGGNPLTRTDIEVYLPQVPNWEVLKDRAIARQYELRNFTEALGFIVRVGLISQKEGHHPDINLHDYKLVVITLSTHAVGGLSVNDFILAAKIDQLI